MSTHRLGITSDPNSALNLARDPPDVAIKALNRRMLPTRAAYATLLGCVAPLLTTLQQAQQQSLPKCPLLDLLRCLTNEVTFALLDTQALLPKSFPIRAAVSRHLGTAALINDLRAASILLAFGSRWPLVASRGT